MFFISKKYIITSLIILSIITANLVSLAIPTKHIKIRYSKSNGLIRIVLESNNYNLIRKSKVFTSYSLVKIAFPDYFVLEPEEIETPLFEFNHKDKNLYFNIKELKWIKLLRLDNPPRLVLDAITEAKSLRPLQPPAPEEKKEKEKKVIKEKRTIVIDPGHGGKDLGIFNPSRSEKDIVLNISGQLQRMLSRKKKTKVVLTRSSDKEMGILNRIKIARKARPDIFISLHLTSSNGINIYTALKRQHEGTPTYLLSSSQLDFIEDSKALAEAIGNALRANLNKDLIYKSLNIPLIAAMDCPSVLIELPGPDFLDYNSKTILSISRAIEEAITTLWD